MIVDAWELIQHLINPQWILDHGGLWLLIFIIFAETGLFLGFFLPGDALLFVTGITLSLDNQISGLNVWEVILLMLIAAIAGNYVGYWFGKKSGRYLFRRKETFLFKRHHLIAANKFYKKYGGMAIFFARFLPIIRTFAPIVAGIVKMDFKKFTFYNIFGGAIWVVGLTLLSYYLGKSIPGLENYILPIILIMIAITSGPMLVKFILDKRRQKDEV